MVNCVGAYPTYMSQYDTNLDVMWDETSVMVQPHDVPHPMLHAINGVAAIMPNGYDTPTGIKTCF